MTATGNGSSTDTFAALDGDSGVYFPEWRPSWAAGTTARIGRTEDAIRLTLASWSFSFSPPQTFADLRLGIDDWPHQDI